VNIFFDTTVLVAASEQSHPHFAQAAPALLRVAAGSDRGFMSTHSIAEVYAAITRLPVRPRIHPQEAARMITENVLRHFSLVSLSKEDYLATLKTVATAGRPGATIYDALLLRCAEKSSVDRVYTFNVGHFMDLAPPSLAQKICSP
jgi:predicted nucleic acid-binding protein